jgi:outer membrane protein OmpA-like peptidoglycan-associated protein
MARWQTFAAGLAALALSAGLMLSATSSALGSLMNEEDVLNEIVNEEDVPSALKPPETGKGRTVEEQRLIDWTRTNITSQLSHLKGRKGLDFNVSFEYMSAKISLSSLPTLRILGEALTSLDLKGSAFIIEGYTNAKGTTEFNQKLSERRADAVKRFLVQEYKIPAADLKAVGYGKSRLKNPSDPFGAENDRIRIVNRNR